MCRIDFVCFPQRVAKALKHNMLSNFPSKKGFVIPTWIIHRIYANFSNPHRRYLEKGGHLLLAYHRKENSITIYYKARLKKLSIGQKLLLSNYAYLNFIRLFLICFSRCNTSSEWDNDNVWSVVGFNKFSVL